MTIHAAIKKRRTELKLSQEGLAKRITTLQGPDLKPIGRQTVQHWENGQSAPKRLRLGAVAEALETTPEALLAGRAEGVVTTDGGNLLAPGVEYLREIHQRNPQLFENLVGRLEVILASLREADGFLREDLGVKGYVTMERAKEKLDVAKTDLRVEGTLEKGGLDSNFGDLYAVEDRKARGTK